MTIYRRLLRLAAPSLERQYGDEMEDMVRARAAEVHGWRRTRVWLRELSMAAALGWSERFGERARRQRRDAREIARGKAGPMDTLGQDIRQAARRLRRSPAFTTATIFTLGLAIGANAAIFAVVERVVINPLPYPRSDRLIELDHGSVTLKIANRLGNAPGMYFLYKDRARSLQSAALYAMAARTLTGAGEAERLRTAIVTPSLGSVLLVPPAAGRWFSDSEGQPGGANVAVISHGLWMRTFAGRDFAGHSLVLDGVAQEVIGVMPPEFDFPERGVDVWLPARLSPSRGFGTFGYSGVARLRDGVSLETARAELQGLLAGIADAYPGDPGARGNVATKLTFVGGGLKEARLFYIERTLWVLLAAVGVVLLVACANVANLFLVRAELGQRDIAIRRALGAAEWRLGRYFYSESFLLAGLGGSIATAIAWAALRVLVQAGPANLPRLHEIRLDPIGVAYIAAVSIAAAIALGSIPLWRGVSMSALRESGRGNTAARHRYYVRHVLLGAQVAMALVLLVGSGLMVRSLQNLRALDPGFKPDSTLTFKIALPPSKYTTADDMTAVHHALIDRLSALPGVVSASASSCLPLQFGCNGNTLLVEGDTYPAGTLPPLSLVRAVSGGYFETMGMRILRGRSITRADVEHHEPIAVISQALARNAFTDRDPIGRRIASNQPPGRDGVRHLEWLTVVGVVNDTPTFALTEPTPMAMTFIPMSIANGADTTRILPSAALMNVVVRTTTPPLSLTTAARQSLRAIDPDLALAQFTSLQQMLDGAAAQMAFTMVLLGLAAAVALVLGAIGIYGVTSYIVGQRTGEIGVRLALGADPAGITWHIVRQGGTVALAGIVFGLGGALAAGRLIASVLYGVSPRDFVTLATMATALMAIALIACWIPARRAAHLSPTVALRTE
jgi:putative ABC transport system permease protein